MKRRAILLLASMGAALALASGVALAVTKQCQTGVTCYGTKERDKLLGTGGNNEMFAKGSGDRLEGFGSNDELHGQGGNDKVFGGTEDDSLFGGPANDALDGGDGNDLYNYLANKWGKDTITDAAASDNDYLTGNRVAFYNLTTDLTINLNSDPALPEAKNASGKSTVNWPDSVIDNAYSDGPGDDQIFGNGAANWINSYEGADVITAFMGNDVITVNDGAGDDSVDCGEDSPLPPDNDNDIVRYDTGDLVVDCETHNP